MQYHKILQYYLLILFINLNFNKQKQGLTPLHLAVISGNAKAVKRVLLKGANRTIVDSKGKTPGQLAIQEGYESLAQMIDNKDGFEEYCNLRQPFRPINKSVKQVVSFFVLFLIVQGLFIAFVVPCMDEYFIEFSIWSSLSIITIILQMLVWLANPGVVNGVDNKEYLRNLRSKQPNEQSSVSSNGSDIKNKITNYDQNKNVRDKNTKIQTNIYTKQTENNKQRVNNEYSISENQNKSTSALQNNEIIEEKYDSIIEKKKDQIFDSLQQYEDSKSYLEPLLENEQSYISSDILMLLFKNYPMDQICLDCQIVKPYRSKHCEICKKCIRVYDHHCPWVDNCVGANNQKYFISFIILLWFSMLSIITITLLHIMNKYDKYYDDSIFTYLIWFKNLSESNKQLLYYTKYAASSIILAITLPFFFMLTMLCFVQLKNLFLNLTTYERFNSKALKDQLREPSSHGSNPNNFDSELSNNSQNKEKLANQNQKKTIISNHSQKKCSFFNAYQMCCINSKNDQLNFNKKACLDEMINQEKEESIYT